MALKTTSEVSLTDPDMTQTCCTPFSQPKGYIGALISRIGFWVYGLRFRFFRVGFRGLFLSNHKGTLKGILVIVLAIGPPKVVPGPS